MLSIHLNTRQRTLVRFREGGRRHAGLVRIKLHYEAAVHTAPGANGQRGASERSGRLLG